MTVLFLSLLAVAISCADSDPRPSSPGTDADVIEAMNQEKSTSSDAIEAIAQKESTSDNVSFSDFKKGRSEIWSLAQIGVSPDHLVLVYSGRGVLETLDGGLSWQQQRQPSDGGRVAFSASIFQSDLPLVLVDEKHHSNGGQSYVSEDLGKTWIESPKAFGLASEVEGPFFIRNRVTGSRRAYGVWQSRYEDGMALRRETLYSDGKNIRRMPGHAGYMRTLVQQETKDGPYVPNYAACSADIDIYLEAGLGDNPTMFVACGDDRKDDKFASVPIMSGLVKITPEEPNHSPRLVLDRSQLDEEQVISSVVVNPSDPLMIAALVADSVDWTHGVNVWISRDEGETFQWIANCPEDGSYVLGFSDPTTVVLQVSGHGIRKNKVYTMHVDHRRWFDWKMPDSKCKFFSTGPNSTFCYGGTLFKLDPEKNTWKDLTESLRRTRPHSFARLIGAEDFISSDSCSRLDEKND